MLELKQVRVRRGSAEVVQGIDLRMEEDHLVIVGRNGMGKSSLCQAITRHLPCEGEILWDGRAIQAEPIEAFTRGGIGYVPQGRHMWASLTVQESLSIVPKPHGTWSAQAIYALFPRLAERRRHAATNLSGGEQQMLAIGRALQLHPKLLILDEPSEGLAPVIVEELTQLLISLPQRHGIRVMLIEQNLRMACSIGQNIHIMVNGRLPVAVPSQRLATDHALQRQYLGVT